MSKLLNALLLNAAISDPALVNVSPFSPRRKYHSDNGLMSRLQLSATETYGFLIDPENDDFYEVYAD